MRTRLITIAALLLLTFVAISHVSAQKTMPTASPDCKPKTVFDKFSTLKSSGDNEKDLATLQGLIADIDAQVISCHGMTFTGSQHQQVLGSFDFPAGDYKITATTQGFLIAKLKSSETCIDYSKDTLLFNLMQGDGSPKAEKLISMQSDCHSYLTIENASDKWTITFEPIS